LASGRPNSRTSPRGSLGPWRVSRGRKLPRHRHRTTVARRSARQATLFIEPAKCDHNVRFCSDSGGIADIAALRICAANCGHFGGRQALYRRRHKRLLGYRLVPPGIQRRGHPELESRWWNSIWAISKPRLPRLLLVCRAIGVKNECIRFSSDMCLCRSAISASGRFCCKRHCR
jgi:hypothetical protein